MGDGRLSAPHVPWDHTPTPQEAFERARRRYLRDRAALDALDARGGHTSRPSRASTKAPGTISGYPIVYGQETTIGGMFREIIAPGAAGRLLGVEDVRALFNHDKNHVLGRTTNGTLRLEEDGHGVRMRVELPDTPTAREVHELLRRGDVSQGSFAFWPKRERWYPADQSGLPLVVIDELERLYDVSVVTYPAYPGTSAGVGLADVRDTERTLAGRVRLHELRQRHGTGSPVPPAAVRRYLADQLPIRQHIFTLEVA